MQISDVQNDQQAHFLSELRSLNRGEIKRYYRDLEPPSFAQLTGEFDAELLDQGGGFSDFLTRKLLNSYGTWVGKAFEPVSESAGRGYTCFRRQGKIVANLKSTIRLGPSLTGPGEALLIEYASTSRGAARWMADEVRQVCPGLLLGIGTYGARIGRKDRWRRKMPFALLGPVRPLQLLQVSSKAA